MSPAADVHPTLGALLAGSMAAVGLSAVLGFQTFLYFQIFPSDAQQYKLLVVWLWASDAVHTVLIGTSIWHYLISNFANPDIVKEIFPPIAVVVSLTALITLSVNTFYGWRIHRRELHCPVYESLNFPLVSKQNWWLTTPIAFLSIIRVGLAVATTTEMFIERTFPAFGGKFKGLFTSGLAISAITDIIVSAARYYYLRIVRQGYSMSHEAVDSVLVFTINDGCLTCAVVLASIACWLSMPHNFVYLAIYFSIAKLYSNSVLATYAARQLYLHILISQCSLNLRNWYRHRYIGSRPIGIQMKRPNNAAEQNALTPATGTNSLPTHGRLPSAERNGLPGKMEVFVDVDHQVEYSVGNFPRGDHDTDTHSNKSMTVA
ncbi:hypothetical protein FB45DRAFT_1061340 [Roridomyces roridus]|uniref:DUF6534 domain-containing protein n=1 Tax=Roridomyces roridus TaxID=1738132 RepID=A0AAD7BJX1_9AGAR|nr:hypothetical protein FB45DRAFT_1061340 [Roridomyces roridus]